MNPLMFLNPGRWLLYAAFLGALALGAWRLHYVIDSQGYNRAQAEYTAAALKASEAARATEQVLIAKNLKVDNDYQKEKRRRVADAAVSAGRLQELNAVIARANSDSTTTGGTNDDPRYRIIAECAGTVEKLDNAVKQLADQASALQSYTREVCVNK